ncbi:TPA: hypothetical protein L0X89_004676 [Escherichia coli]|nr:hypothetical protein [Escherichia coli]
MTDREYEKMMVEAVNSGVDIGHVMRVLWKPYSVYHIDADGKKFSFYIFAISREHAACVVDDIRETAWLGDEIAG